MISDLERAKEVLRSWADRRSFVRRLWIFGSRAKGTSSPESDIDVAIAFDPVRDGETCETTWICEGDRWQAELQTELPWRIQLEWYDVAGSTPTVAKGVDDGGVLVYERTA